MRRAFSVAAFLVNGDDVLLIKHKRLGLWLPVGGEVERVLNREDGEGLIWETPLEAVKREIKEETGLDANFFLNPYALDGEPPGFIGYEEHDAGIKGTHLNFNFVALVTSREIKGDGSFTDHIWHPIHAPIRDTSLVTTKSVAQCVMRIHWLRRERRLPEGV